MSPARGVAGLDRSRSDPGHAIAITALVSIPLLVGLLAHDASAGVVGALGALNAFVPQGPATPWGRERPRFVATAALVNAAAFSLGALVGLTGAWAPLLFGLGFAIAAYLAFAF